MTIEKINISNLTPNPYQPQSRIKVSDETSRIFGESILEHGILQTPVCRKVLKDNPGGISANYGYEVADGWQRRAGCVWAVANGHPEYQEIDVDVRELTDEQMADMVLEANEVRKDLNPIDRAWVYQKYLDSFPQITQVEFARRHNKSQAEVSNTIRLLDLPHEVQEMIISCEIKESHGRTLLRVKDPLILTEMARWAVRDNMSVVALEEKITEYLEAIQPKMETGTETEQTEETETEPADEKTVEEPLTSSTTTGTTLSQPQESVDEKPTEIPPQTSTTLAPVQTVPEQTTTSPPPAQKPSTQPSTKPTTPAPARAQTPPAPPTPKWNRKLVIEEKDGHVQISMMKAGGTPEFYKHQGDFYEAITAAGNWAAALEKKWEESK